MLVRGNIYWHKKVHEVMCQGQILTSGSYKPLLLEHKPQSLETWNQVILKGKFISMWVCFDEKMYRPNILSSKWPWNIFQCFSKNSVAEMVWKRKLGNMLLSYASKGKHLLTHKSPLSYLPRSDFDLGVI